MSGMPNDAQLYEAEYDYWPWSKVIGLVSNWVEQHCPTNACVLDYMCGTGYLLNEIANSRPDIHCFGCSIIPEYIDYSQQKYPRITVELCDALEYTPRVKPDIVTCTAGIHHLKWQTQEIFIKKVASELETGKYFVVGEELIRPFNNETERRLAVVEMFSAVLIYMINKNAPSNIIPTAIEVLKADLLELEYKTDRVSLERALSPYFDIEECFRCWPDIDAAYGDHVFICKKR